MRNVTYLVGVDHTLPIKNLKSLFQLRIEPSVNCIEYINTIDINKFTSIDSS